VPRKADIKRNISQCLLWAMLRLKRIAEIEWGRGVEQRLTTLLARTRESDIVPTWWMSSLGASPCTRHDGCVPWHLGPDRQWSGHFFATTTERGTLIRASGYGAIVVVLGKVRQAAVEQRQAISWIKPDRLVVVGDCAIEVALHGVCIPPTVIGK
jgi:hypothetical protein